MKFFTIISAILLTSTLSQGTGSDYSNEGNEASAIIRQGNTEIVKEEYLKNIKNTGDAICLRGLGNLGSSKNFLTLG